MKLHAFNLYRRLISANVRSQMQYRTAFLFDLLGTGIGTAAAFGTLTLILQRFGNIAGWMLADIAFLYGTVETGFGLMDMIFSGFDPGTFGQQVRRGAFDQVLLRPAGVTLQVLGSDFALRRLARIAQGALVLGYALLRAEVHWTVPKVLFLSLIHISEPTRPY